MSFFTIRDYSRPILQPISLETRPKVQHSRQPTSQPKLPQLPSVSNSWTSTTHSFLGTTSRVSPSSWPPSKFNQNPADIRDDPAYDIPYDAETAKHFEPGSAKGVYQMYASDDRAPKDEQHEVPAPQIVVKRYVPRSKSSNTKDNKTPLTLLFLPGMGSPKEVGSSRKCACYSCLH